VVMDCEVVRRLPADKYGQLSWLVRPSHIYTGREQIHGSIVKLVSPTAANNGLKLTLGKRYRISAVDWKNLLYHRKGRLFFWGYVLALK